MLENIETASDILIKEPHQLDSTLVNSLIGRLLFVMYLIDRNVKIGEYGYLTRQTLLDDILTGEFGDSQEIGVQALLSIDIRCHFP